MGRIFIFLFFILALEQGLKAQETWEWVVKPIWKYEGFHVTKTDESANTFIIECISWDNENDKTTFILDKNGVLKNTLNQYDKIGFNYDGGCYGGEPLSFNDGLCLVRKKDKWGYIDANGYLTIPCRYDSASNFWCGRASVIKKDSIYQIDKKNRILKQQALAPITDSIKRAFIREQTETWGNEEDIIKEYGKNKDSVDITYQTNIDKFALANCPNPYYSITDTTNENYEDEELEEDSREKWFSQLKDKPYFKSKMYDYISTHRNNLLIVIKDNKWGAIDTNGKIVVTLIYEELISTPIGNIFARKGGKYGFLNSKGTPVSNFTYDWVQGWRSSIYLTHNQYVVNNIDGHPGDNGLNPISRPINAKNIAHTQTFPLFIDEWHCGDTLLEAIIGEKMGLINANGKVIVPAIFDNIGKFDYKTYKKDNFIPVEVDSAWGIIRIKTNTPSPCLPQITFSKPTPVEVSNSSQQNPYEVGKNEKLSLLFQIEGCQNIVSHKIEIWVDGKAEKLSPLQTKTGSAPLPSQNMIFEEELFLLEGEHKIEIHYENAVSKTLYVKVAKKERRLYVLAIAPTVGLKWNEKDAKDFAEVFRSQQGKLYDSVVTKVITGKDSTEKGNLEIYIAEIIESIKNKMGGDDIFMVFISSHGEPYNQGDLLLLASNYKSTIPTKTALLLSTLEADIGKLSCKKILFIDACYSGVASSAAYTLKKSPSQDSLWHRLENSPNGITYFASSASNQQSTEANAFQNGVFTEALLRGIGEMKADENKDNLISTNELANYLKKTVPLLIKDIAPDLPNPQEPTVPKNTNTDIHIYQQ